MANGYGGTILLNPPTSSGSGMATIWTFTATTTPDAGWTLVPSSVMLRDPDPGGVNMPMTNNPMGSSQWTLSKQNPLKSGTWTATAKFTKTDTATSSVDIP